MLRHVSARATGRTNLLSEDEKECFCSNSNLIAQQNQNRIDALGGSFDDVELN